MSRTVTAMFDTRADADAGRQRLLAANVDADNVKILDQASSGYNDKQYSTTEDRGFWASISNAFLPDEDRHTYEEGVRRGGFVLTADVDESQVDHAVTALEDTNSVDMDERSSKWKSEGWDYKPTAAGAAGGLFGAGGRDRDGDMDRSSLGSNANMGSGMSDRDTSPMNTTSMTATAGSNNEERLQVMEEQLIVGKREVERGGVRVRSYVTEKPVHEQVRLRQERVEVERRPVDRAMDDTGTANLTGDAFQERTIEMRETSEEAVVSKQGRVVEEVVVRKTSDERVEEINDTVRRTDVDVEQLGGTDRSMSGRDSMMDRDNMTGRDSMTDRDNMGRSDTGKTGGLAGMVNEGIGNAKQGIGGLTGSDSLKQDGMQQERKGEMQQGKGPESV